MELQNNWAQIRKLVNNTFRRQFYVAIASLDANGNPTNTPIGSLFLNRDQTGFYFEKYPSKLPACSETNPKVCILAVNSGRWFWLKALFKNRFNTPPGLKLYGILGNRRQATNVEISRLNKRMKVTKGLKGNTYLWGKMAFVREIKFTEVEYINLGEMTKNIN